MTRDEPNGIDELYTGAVTVAAGLIVLFGLIMIAVTLIHGGGPFSTGIIMGFGFTILGSARLWLARR